jgi:hypothetical protein
MAVDNTMMKLGFTKDESNNLKLNEVFKDNARLKEIRIDVYPTNPLTSSSIPFMLLLRTIEKKILVKNNGTRFVLKRNDSYETHLMNILFSEVTECYYKFVDGFFEFILNIQNTYYKITVFN